MPKPRTVHVRILVVVDSGGAWNASGNHYCDDETLLREAREAGGGWPLGDGNRVYWIEADLELPPKPLLIPAKIGRNAARVIE
jgi:hypothetical protein